MPEPSPTSLLLSHQSKTRAHNADEAVVNFVLLQNSLLRMSHVPHAIPNAITYCSADPHESFIVIDVASAFDPIRTHSRAC